MKLIPEKDFPELKRDPNSGVWYIVKEVKGKKALFKSTREHKSKTKAVKEGQRLLAEYLCADLKQMAKVVWKFEDIAKRVLDLKKNKSKRTIRSATDHIEKHLTPYFNGYNLVAIDEDLWEKYISASREKNPSRRLFNDAKQMKSIIKYAFERSMITRKIKIRNPDPETTVGKFYSDEELKSLLMNAGEDLSLQIKIGFMMGFRKLELLGLPWMFFDWNKQIVALPEWYTKNRKARRVPIHSALYPILWQRFMNSDSPFIFPSKDEEHQCPVASNKSAWQTCKRLANVQGRFHDLRHTFMSLMVYRFKQQIPHAAKIAGMSVVVAAKIYAKPSDENLRETLNAFQGIPGSELVKHNDINTIQ